MNLTTDQRQCQKSAAVTSIEYYMFSLEVGTLTFNKYFSEISTSLRVDDCKCIVGIVEG